MINDVIKDSIDFVLKALPYKTTRIIRRNNKKIKKIYYGNFEPINIDFYYMLRRFL